MKFSRIGESLWSEWDGEDYTPASPDNLVFFTETHVDLDHEVIRRALASTLQRDGSVDSLSEAFKLLQEATVVYGHAGIPVDQDTIHVCDALGETYYGETVENPYPVTWVEVSGDF